MNKLKTWEKKLLVTLLLVEIDKVLGDEKINDFVKMQSITQLTELNHKLQRIELEEKQ